MGKPLPFGASLVSLAAIVTALLAALTLGVAPSRQATVATAGALHHSPTNIQNAHLFHQARYSTSSNWAGYATTGRTYRDVKGTWTQPAAYCARGQTAYSAFWIGIDGATTSTVEQIGTDADCSNGAPTYYAWYEMYPRYPVYLRYRVAPRDVMAAEVSTNGSGSFTLTIRDVTRGWRFVTTQTLRQARLGSAEWIAEAPSSQSGVLPLTNFGTVSFTNSSANGVSISSNPNPDEIVMVAYNGIVKAQPSRLGSGGTAFSVTWKHS